MSRDPNAPPDRYLELVERHFFPTRKEMESFISEFYRGQTLYSPLPETGIITHSKEPHPMNLTRFCPQLIICVPAVVCEVCRTHTLSLDGFVPDLLPRLPLKLELLPSPEEPHWWAYRFKDLDNPKLQQEMTEQATKAGWTSVTVFGKVLNVCPNCQHEHLLTDPPAGGGKGGKK